MLIGTSVAGPFFMVKVVGLFVVKVTVPLNVVELLLVIGLPMSLKFNLA